MNKLRLVVAVAALALVALFSLVGGGPLSAQGPAAGGSSSSKSVDLPGALPPELAAVAREEAAKREADLAKPEAVKARRESRTRFAAFGPVQAKDLARETFGGTVTESRAPGPHLGRGERVAEFIGDRWAKIDRGEGEQPAVVRSVLPMLARDGSGKRAPVDLTLTGTGSVLAPANPLVDIAVARDAAAGAALAKVGLGLRPLAPMAGGSELQLVGGEKAFWADVDADTDYMVSPTARGFESFVQVRSEEAPEQFSLAVDLPKGAELRDVGAENGGLEVVDPDRPEKEEVLARITPPMAWDADGTPVKVTYAVEGSTLVLRYPHREKDLHYPLLVDPQVIEDFYDVQPLAELGWVYGKNNANLHGGYQFGGGLALVGDSGVTYPAGSIHGWSWQAPGDSFIFRADFAFLDHSPANPSVPDEVRGGIWDPRPGGDWNPGPNGVREPPSFAPQGISNPWITTASLSDKYKKICQNWNGTPYGNPPVPECSPGSAGTPAGTPGNMFILQQYWPAGSFAIVQPVVWLDGAIMALSEFNAPTNLSVGFPLNTHHPTVSEWSDDAGNPTHDQLTVSADDGGLGIDRFEVDDDPTRGPDGPDDDPFDDDALGGDVLACTGSVADGWPCPTTDATGTIHYQTRADGDLASVTELPEGITQWWARAIDIVDNMASTQFPVRIDRSAPTIDLSGSLATSPNSPTSDKNLRITVTDGARGGAAADQRSGVDRVDVLVDGKRVTRFGRDRNEWLLSNGFPASAGAADLNFRYGDAAEEDDIPVAGDWDGDGDDSVGVFRKTIGTFLMRNSNSSGDADANAAFYQSTDVPLAGNWDGDADDTTGVFRPSNNTFYLRNTNNPTTDITVAYGAAQAPYNDIPLVGDWDGDGDDTIGVYRRQTATFLLRNSNTAGSPDISVAYGTPSSPTDDVPVVGDWDGDGDDTIGVYRRSTNTWLLRNSNTAGSAQITAPFGTGIAAGGYQQIPVPGDWDNNNTDTPGIQEAACTGDSCPLTRDWAYRLTDQYGGNQEVKVVATDKLGHQSSEVLNVTRPVQGTLLDPTDGARTAAKLPLRAQLAGGGATTVKFQYRRPLQPWTDIPSAALKDAATGANAPCVSGTPLSCTMNLTGGLSPALTIDFTALSSSFLDDRSGSYEVRGLFPSLGVTKAASVLVDERGLDTNDAQADIGPGRVNLATGNFSYTSDDVSFATPGSPLTVSRTYNSRDADGKATGTDITTAGGGSLGPGWVLTSPVDEAGADYALLRELPADPITGERVELQTSDGTTISFWKNAGDFDPEDGYESYALTKPASDRYELKDSSGNTVVFTKTNGQFVPTEVRPPAATETPDFKYLYSYEAGLNGRPRIKQIIAPREPGVTCTPGQTDPGMGCRALNFTYAATTTASGSTIGDYAGRLKSVSTISKVPHASPDEMRSEAVADYRYDSSGRLREQWDSRTPSLKETYAYETDGRLKTITPPGEQPWNIAYQQLLTGGGFFTPDTDAGRLLSVSRTPSGGTAMTTTMAYRVPLTTGAGGPWAMGKTDVAGWDQVKDWPIDATAMYPPGVAATQPATKAVVHYLGRRGKAVNTANPAPAGLGRIGTTEYDVKGNVIRSLTPANRLLVLAPATPNKDKLDTEMTYSPDGQQLLEQLGPVHEIRSGSTFVDARQRTVTTYDEGAPPARYGEPAPNLPTTITSSAQPVSGADFDARTTKTDYDWKLRKPTKTVDDPTGENIVTTTIYDKTTGRVIETRTPEAPSHNPKDSATTAHATKTIYYSKENADPDCAGESRAGMPCKTMPAGQPGTAGLPDLAVTTYDYNFRLQPTTTTETVSGSTARTTTITYDTAARTSNETTTATAKRPDLVVAYNFDQSSAPAADRSMYANNGTVSGATWTAIGGGGALSFDGVNDKVTIPNSSSIQVGDKFTFEAKIKPTALPSNTNLSLLGSTTGGPNAFLWNAKPTLAKTGSGDISQATGTVATGSWYHVAFTKNGSTTKLYIDGQDVTGTVTNYTMATVASALTLGSNGTAANKWFNGMMDDVRIYNRALGPQEILKNTTTPVAAAENSTVTSTTAYSSTTGKPITVSDGSKTVTTGYDSLGRIETYRDADNPSGTNSTYTYDTAGRPWKANDTKGEQTRSYDTTTGDLIGLSDTQAGAFSATYNADGAMLTHTFPGGIQAVMSYDPAGVPVELNYTKTTNCSSNCLWLRDKVRENIHGQALWRDSNLSHQDYSYDNLGRLRSVLDTVAGQCSSRIYTYDKDSNRLSKKVRSPGAGGTCPSSGGTVTNSAYDAADRLTTSGVTYDTLGRIAAIPPSHASALAGGGGLSTTYSANDMPRTQTQDDVTKGWLLDPSGIRHRASMPNGNAQEILHYSDPSDNPAWTEHKVGSTVASWTRTIKGIDGSLAAVYDSQAGGTIALQLTNLHGDVIATASNSSTATGLTNSFEADEFGNPRTASNLRYGWLGGKQRRTELASGVIQMGVRSYVPAMGRFTSVDPIDGGSASAYDYAGADPVNNFDLDGRACVRPHIHGIAVTTASFYWCKKKTREFGRRLRRGEDPLFILETIVCTAVTTAAAVVGPLAAAAIGSACAIAAYRLSNSFRNNVRYANRTGRCLTFTLQVWPDPTKGIATGDLHFGGSKNKDYCKEK